MICCFLGHREICKMEDLKIQLYRSIEELIDRETADTFSYAIKQKKRIIHFPFYTPVGNGSRL